MEAKDTVLGHEELVKKTGRRNFTPKEGREAQAEITGKIMLEQGRKEVVEWIEENILIYDGEQGDGFQAQKKVWGINGD